MKLNYITVMVRNMEKSLDFYEKLVGLKVMNKMEMAAGRIAFLSNGEGETMLEIIEFADSKKVETRGMVMSYAAGESLEEIRARAEELGYSPSAMRIFPYCRGCLCSFGAYLHLLLPYICAESSVNRNTAYTGIVSRYTNR